MSLIAKWFHLFPLHALCDCWTLDSFEIHRNVSIGSITRAKYSNPHMSLPCLSGLLPNGTVLDILRASLGVCYHLYCFSQKKKKMNGASIAAPSVLSPLGGSKKKKKKHTWEKWYSIANYDGNYCGLARSISRSIMEGTNWRIDADCHKCRGNLTSIGVRRMSCTQFCLRSLPLGRRCYNLWI